MWQATGKVPLSACLLLSFAQVFGYPLSWHKVQIGPSIAWTGWELNFAAGAFSLPEANILKFAHRPCTLLGFRKSPKLKGLTEEPL